MYRPPKLWSAHLDELVSGCGGPAAACKLLDITSRTLRRWQSGGVPRMALELLWYYGSYGAAAAEAEYGFASELERTISSARQRQIDELQALLRAYETNGPPAVAPERQAAMAVNDEFGAIPPTPGRAYRR